ncbi:hypothetical protein BH11PSE11_BH11PSE11_20030 [soil metagenome]
MQNATVNAKDLEHFEIAARAAGYEEVLERRWAPETLIELHTHPFDAHAVVTQGEMWLTRDGVTQHLSIGDTFTIAREVPHAERYGAEGATYLVARRTAGPIE